MESSWRPKTARMPRRCSCDHSTRACLDVFHFQIVKCALRRVRRTQVLHASLTRSRKTKVAIKKVSTTNFEDAQGARQLLREIHLLRHFRGHENILTIKVTAGTLVRQGQGNKREGEEGREGVRLSCRMLYGYVPPQHSTSRIMGRRPTDLSNNGLTEYRPPLCQKRHFIETK